MIEIPDSFFKIRYNGANYPGASGYNGLASGEANCQVFAYEILRFFKLDIPNFRSSELWDDQTYTQVVSQLKPLDILLWNKTSEAWGAHVGLYLGDNQAIHLSKPIGSPVVWPLEKFLEQPVYKVFIGAKRIINPSS